MSPRNLAALSMRYAEVDTQMSRSGVVVSRGLIVRARRMRGGIDDFTIKLRRPAPVALSRKLRRSRNLGLEMDVLPGSSIWSAALTRRLNPSVLNAVLAGRRPIRTLLSTEQRKFLRTFVADVEDYALTTHGPIEITRTPARVARSRTKLMVECWTYPDGSRLLEVSTKCAPARAVRVAAGTGRFLLERGIDLSAPQKTKTEVSVDYFAR
jgi:hypothetical protein